MKKKQILFSIRCSIFVVLVLLLTRSATAQGISAPCTGTFYSATSPEGATGSVSCDPTGAYLFTTYEHNNTSYHLPIFVNYSQTVAGGKSGDWNFRVRVERRLNGVTTDVTVNPNPLDGWEYTNDEGWSTGNPAHLFDMNLTHGKGEYVAEIQVPDLVGWQDRGKFVVLVIPQITKIWVEASPICEATYATWSPSLPSYTFQVKTTPPIQNVAITSSYLDINYQLDVSGLYVQGINHITNWAPGVTDAVNQTIPGSELYTWITSYAGQPLPLNIRLNDNVSTTTLDIVDAPLIINTGMTNIANASSPSTLPGPAFHFKNITVNGSQVWTPTDNPATDQASSGTTGPTISKLRLDGDLIVTPGSSLTIQDMDVEFGPNSHVVVQTNPGTTDYGGRLKLDDATLVAYHGGGCANTSVNYLWPGVKVMGNASQSQALLGPNANGCRFYQGMLDMANNSTIALATNGVQLWGGTLASSGGIIHARNSNFTNNKRAVEFEQYKGMWPTPDNVSFFQLCNFTTNDVLPSPFFCFISAWGVKNVKIKGCFFSDNVEDPNATNYGVFGEDASFIIEKYGSSSSYPTFFANLRHAFRVNDITGLGGMFVKNTHFDGNGIGIFSRGVKAPSITSNDFLVGIVGVRLETGTGFAVRNNVFDLSSEDAITVGTLAWNTGIDPNEIRNNEYNDLFEGSLNNFKNRGSVNNVQYGLQYLCNAYDGVDVGIAALGFNASTDGIAGNQGSSSDPAGNDLNSNVVDLYNDVAGFNYHYYNGGPTPSTQGSIAPIGTSFMAICPSTDEIDDFPGGAAHIFAKIQHFLYDSTATEEEHNRDSLYFWVNKWTSPYGAVMKTDMLMEDGQIDAALALYANITTEYEMEEDEVAEFGYGGTLLGIRAALLDEELSLKDIDVEQLAAIEEVADNATAWAMVRAQNWLTLYDGRQFDNTVLHVDLEEEPEFRKIAVSDKTKLYPNPVQEAITVNYVNEGENGSILQILDITGRTVLTEQLEGANGQKIVNVSKLMPGIYLYKIVEGGQTTLQDKFVKE